MIADADFVCVFDVLSKPAIIMDNDDERCVMMMTTVGLLLDAGWARRESYART